MKLPFYVDLRPSHSGVTGSCFHMKAVFPNRNTYSVLVDCGMFQGRGESQFNDVPLFHFLKNAESLILTHNHIDHIGRVLELLHNGFRGKIYTSEQTLGLLDKAWRDCEKIERMNAAIEKRTPKFKSTHITEALRRVEPLQFRKRVQIHPNIWVTLLENGHVFGSAMVLLEIESSFAGYKPINFFFTGDYNDQNHFFTVPEIPSEIREMPVHIICEATYGQNSRQVNRRAVFEENILKLKQRNLILIPVFAFERGQIILSILRRMQNEGKLDTNIPIYLDGKLFKEYTMHYIKNAGKYFDKVTGEEILPQNINWITKPTQREEILSNDDTKIIIASGGMLSFGPSQAYMSYVISNPNAAIHFTGYQCEGTIGNSLKVANETGKLLELRGKLVNVECSVFYTEEFSAHALKDRLLQLLEQFLNRRSITLNHGTQEAKQDLAQDIIRANIAREVGISSRENLYRFTPYKLEKVVPIS